jgi:hypothetical protein
MFVSFQNEKNKNALNGQRFADISDIQHNVSLLYGILEDDFQYFPAYEPSSHEVHSFTWRVFQRR